MIKIIVDIMGTLMMTPPSAARGGGSYRWALQIRSASELGSWPKATSAAEDPFKGALKRKLLKGALEGALKRKLLKGALEGALKRKLLKGALEGALKRKLLKEPLKGPERDP